MFSACWTVFTPCLLQLIHIKKCRQRNSVSHTLFAAVVAAVWCVSAAGRSRCSSRACGRRVVMISVPGRLLHRERGKRGQSDELMSAPCFFFSSIIRCVDFICNIFNCAYFIIFFRNLLSTYNVHCVEESPHTKTHTHAPNNIHNLPALNPVTQCATILWNEDCWGSMRRKAQTNSERTCCISSQLSEACNPRLPPFGSNH